MDDKFDTNLIIFQGLFNLNGIPSVSFNICLWWRPILMIWFIIDGCGKVEGAIADCPEDGIPVPQAAALISARGKVEVVCIPVTILVNICAVSIVKGGYIYIKRYFKCRPPYANCI